MENATTTRLLDPRPTHVTLRRQGLSGPTHLCDDNKQRIDLMHWCYDGRSHSRNNGRRQRILTSDYEL